MTRSLTSERAETSPASGIPDGPSAIHDLRRVAAAATAGLVIGFVVIGWGSRLAMMLLARLNPEVTGQLSDDGFPMGRFDLGDTMGLVFFGTIVGVFGGLVFLGIRNLRFGPPWFRTTSMTVGPTVVAGSILVHSDGIDFRILEPTWLAIGLFVALPALSAYSVATLADRWLRDDLWFLTGRHWRLVAVAPALLLGPALTLVAVAVAGRIAYRRLRPVRSAARYARLAVAARLALIAVFALALVDLVDDIVQLV